MHFSITLAHAKELFLLPCSIANSSKTNIAVLDYVYLKIENSIATVFGTDGQSIIKKQIDVTVGDFEICIEAKKLSASLHGYTDNEKNIAFNFDNEKKVEIKYSRSKVNIATADPQTYPIPIIAKPDQFQFTCSPNQLIAGIGRVQYAKAKLDVRKMLNHINFSIVGDSLNLHATNGHRLVKTSVTVNDSMGDFEGILPTGLVDLILSVQPETQCQFFFDQSNFYCQVGHVTLASKFVAEQYMNVSKLINPAIVNSTTLKTSALLQSANRIKLFLSGVKIPKLNLTLENADLKMNADAGTGNEIDDYVEAQSSSNEQTSISLNPLYLIDALKNIHSERVCLSFTNNNMLKISDPDSTSFDAVIMAMR